MAKQAYVYSGTDWVPLASEVTNLTGYQTKALNQFAHRNLIINGDMQVAQRGTSVPSLTTTGYRTADRWQFQITTQGTWTMSVENDAPTGSGFRKSTKVLCTTADASPAAGDVVLLSQTIEGQNLQQIKKGTAAAEQLTVSFWVKSNVTGTYIFEIYDADNTRAISKSYTISASGVWEYKTITIPADTTGAFDNDNDASVFIQWFLGAGSNLTSGTLNSSSWVSPTTANRVVGQVNLASAISNYWQITGVQLEINATATPFEFEPFETTLRKCQRYYQKSYNYSVVPGTADGANATFTTTSRSNTSIPSLNTGRFGVVMRGSPTMTWYSPSTGASGKIRDVSAGVDRTIVWNFDSGDNFGGWIITDNAPSDGAEVRGQWQAVAEL